ncbi:MAG: hypothetical protein HQK67_09930 [Desulfamplus sp.]|nr:hypothetical protein [Desulfamplus sp.]
MIDSINAYSPISQNIATSKKENSENADLFRHLLGRAAQGKNEGIQDTGSVDKNRSIGALSEISSIKNITINDPLSLIEKKTDELIEKLGLYSDQLENPAVSLKDMDSLLKEITASAGNLLKETDDSGKADQKLVDIVRECAITAHSEYIKFQRGDYLDGFA